MFEEITDPRAIRKPSFSSPPRGERAGTRVCKKEEVKRGGVWDDEKVFLFRGREGGIETTSMGDEILILSRINFIGGGFCF